MLTLLIAAAFVIAAALEGSSLELPVGKAGLLLTSTVMSDAYFVLFAWGDAWRVVLMLGRCSNTTIERLHYVANPLFLPLA